MDEPDEALRCSLLLSLGGAEAKSARVADARDAFERAAESARRLDDTDSLVGRGDRDRDDERRRAPRREAARPARRGPRADRAGAHRPPRRAAQREVGRSCTGSTTTSPSRRGWSTRRSRSRVRSTPRAPWRPRCSARSSSRPDRTRPRERLATRRRDGRARRELRATARPCCAGHAYRLWSLLELGDIPAVDRELELYARLADELRMPEHIWHTYRAARDAGPARRRHRRGRAPRRGGEAGRRPRRAAARAAVLRDPDDPDPQHAGARRRAAAGRPRARRALPGDSRLARRGWSRLAARSGDVELARRELERFAGDDFAAIPEGRQLVRRDEPAGRGDRADRRRRRAPSASTSELLPYEGLVDRRGAGRGVQRARRPCPRPARADDGPPRRRRAAPRQRRGDRDPDGRPARHGALRVSPSPSCCSRATRPTTASARWSCSRRCSARPARWVRAGSSIARCATALEAQGLAGVDVTTSIDDVISALEEERPDMRAHAAPDGTVTILFSDIEDSTVLTERLGDERWLEVLREHNAIFREQISRHDGYEVKSQGDGFMLAFPDPVRGARVRDRGPARVRRARARRLGGAAPGPDGPAHRRGDRRGGRLLRQERDPRGADRGAGRWAARSSSPRSCAQAASSGNGNGLRFDEGRELELKGLAGSHRVFRAEWAESDAASSCLR